MLNHCWCAKEMSSYLVARDSGSSGFKFSSYEGGEATVYKLVFEEVARDSLTK